MAAGGSGARRAYDLLGNERGGEEGEGEREVSYNCYYRTYIDPANSRRVHAYTRRLPFRNTPEPYNAATYILRWDCASDHPDSTAKLIDRNVNRADGRPRVCELVYANRAFCYRNRGRSIYLLKVTRIFWPLLFSADRPMHQVSHLMISR